MNKYLINLILPLLLFATNNAEAQEVNEYAKASEIEVLQQNIQQVENKITTLREALDTSNSVAVILSSKVDSLRDVNNKLMYACDSLQAQLELLNETQSKDRTLFTQNIQDAQGNITATNKLLSERTMWAIIIVALISIVVVVLISLINKKINKGISSIDNVRAAQDALQSAQTKMQEESVALDNKLVDIIDKQLEIAKDTASQNVSNGEVDHSLALKVADEIVRIETNLSRMDPSVKGFKQLSKAVQRIKDNFVANGYEISDMLGKPYNAGMKVIADFVPNENLEIGQQIITGITKPQILYNGKLIQAAQITVSQNI